MNRRHLLSCLLMTSCFASSACTFGPTTEVRTVIVNPGHPIQLLENVTVKGRMLDSGESVTQDIGGWVAMPDAHWQAIKRVLEGGPPK